MHTKEKEIVLKVTREQMESSAEQQKEKKRKTLGDDRETEDSGGTER